MDINFSHAVSNEDLIGVLRTILLFLESINFKRTSTVLQNECSSKGYLQVVSAPAKIVVVHPSAVLPGTLDRGNQTEFPIDDNKSYELQSSVHITTKSENNSNPNSIHMYDTNNSNHYTKNNMLDKYGNSVVVSDNIYLQNPVCECSTSSETAATDNEHTIKKLIEEPKECRNMSPNNQNTNVESRRCPNTIESEIPSRISSKNFSKNSSSEVRGKSLRKTHSNPTLNTNSKSTKVDNKSNESENTDDTRRCTTKLGNTTNCQELRKRFRHLQNEHRKLMGVTTELTIALQTHILGQSENLNSMLNNCRNIYPDLFKSVYNQNSSNHQNILTEHSSSEDIANTTELFEEDLLVKTVFSQTMQQDPSSTNCVQTGELSEKSAHETTVVRDIPESSQIIGNSDNIIQSSSPLSIGQSCVCDNTVHGLPLTNNTIQSSDNILQSSSTRTRTRRNQDSDNISQGSLPSTKTIQNSDNMILQGSSSSRKEQDSKTIRNSENILLQSSTPLKENLKNANKSEGLPPSNTGTFRNTKHSDVPSSSKSIKNEETNENNHKTGVSVEIKSIVMNGSYSTTILTPKLKRPHSCSIILVTTTDKPQSTDSKILLRQVSSKSLDESLLANNPKANQASKINHEEVNTREDTRTEVIVAHTTNQFPEIKNAEQQTSYLDTTIQELFQDNPEIFVTTEHLEKLQQGCKCKSSDESNYSSPRNMYFDLDFRKLKKDMLNGNDNLKLGLIQALRWRITQSERETRDQVISSYIRHDLLGLHSAPNTCGQSTTEIYYCPNKKTPHPLQEGMARLVNTFASLTLGRDYLCQDDDLLISLLVPLVIGTHYSKVKIDDATRDMLMATLQKLSIRNKQRIRMISAGLVEYLVTFLATKHATVSEYCMEYTTALLMNLCLHREARNLLHSSATDVVSLLADLLNTKHQSCMPYVNGAMYSLLGDPYINKEAQRLNLANLIEYHIKRTDGEMRRQLEFILKLHLKGDGQNECGCDPNLEPENEVDLLEPELDRGDSTEVKPTGEELLKNYRLLFAVSGAQVNASYLKCLCRPVTPRSVQSNEEKLVKVTNNFEDNKTMQVYHADILQETNFQVEEQVPKVHARQRCTCLADKSTQSDNPSNVSNNFRSHNPQSCTCTTTANTTEEISVTSNKTSPIKAKRYNSLSEPITGFKSDTENPIKKAPVSEKPSRSNSPDMSYSEETKQFYYTPSAKTGIFEPQKQKKLHRVPPSFTRTIPLAEKINPSPAMCNNPFCPHPYSKSMPVTPKENSSVRNPPYALDYPIGFTTCYRDNNINQMAQLSTTDRSNVNCNNCSNNKRSRYRCNCYNVIRGYIDQTPQDNITSEKTEPNIFDQQNTDKSYILPTQNFCCNCHNSNNVSAREATAQNFDTTANLGNDVLVNFSYEELLNTVHSGNDHVCPNPGVECQCYDVVFQSRPKILRTPP